MRVKVRGYVDRTTTTLTAEVYYKLMAFYGKLDLGPRGSNMCNMLSDTICPLKKDKRFILNIPVHIETFVTNVQHIVLFRVMDEQNRPVFCTYFNVYIADK